MNRAVRRARLAAWLFVCATACGEAQAASETKSLAGPQDRVASLSRLVETELKLSVSKPASIAAPEGRRRDINPYNRDVAMTAPLAYNRRILGEVPVMLTKDDRLLADSEGFRALISPLLTEAARLELAQVLAGKSEFEPGALKPAGIEVEYDPAQLSLQVVRIEAFKRLPEDLFRGGRAEAPEQAPEAFSAYLNGDLAVDRRKSVGKVETPSIFLNGAVRYRNLVFESDITGQEDNSTGDYRIDRRYARLVYDEPEDYRRWYLGDLDPEIRGSQGYVELGGLGVARQKRRFEAFRSNVLGGSRLLVLDDTAIVRVSRNGVFVREFRLDPGQYDLRNVPLDTGSNDVQVEIQERSGRRQQFNYSAYLDAIDLEPGDYEYGAYLGFRNVGAFGSPRYDSGDAAFTGYWRKAFLNRPSLGLGFQASSEVQTLTGQSQFILAKGSRLQVDGSASHSDQAGSGFALAVGFDHSVDSGDKGANWTLVAEYISENFAMLGSERGGNQTSLSISAGYSRRFSADWSATLSGAYHKSRAQDFNDSYSVSASTSYRISPQWSGQLGVEYRELGSPSLFGRKADGFGVNAALIWTPRYNQRGEARYDSARNSGSLRFQQSSENRVGSFGYGLNTFFDDGPGSISGQVDYTANRFDVSLSHTLLGSSFSRLTDEEVTTLRVGSAIAFAGGHVAIGRRINDSFAVVFPHESLRAGGVIVGQNLEGGRYTARSGALGPALSNQLTAYVNQSVRYDARQAPPGYDVGDGVMRVRPSYRSGYAIQVGSAAFVSALGHLVGVDGKPIALASGRVRSLDDPKAAPEPFFTNSAGRFAIQGLEPGKRYRVELFDGPSRGFEFMPPKDSTGLVDLKVVTAPQFAQDR